MFSRLPKRHFLIELHHILPILLLAASPGVALAHPSAPAAQTPLPAPSGPFPVGRASFDWTEESRIDSLAPEPGTKRELTVWIWSPASVNKSSSASEYIPAHWRAAFAKRQPPGA